MVMTLSVLMNEVAWETGHAAVDADVSGEAAAVIKRCIERGHAELTQRRVISWPVNAVPDYATDAAIRFYANEARRKLNRDYTPSDYRAERQACLVDLWRVTTLEPDDYAPPDPEAVNLRYL
jgi:NADPH-dependent ferric siderophore reductase